ncbi:intradiol ring-cleavage dioxygenase [Altibacter sp.]|uniref:dioxygenase family protein n=1 Tax=Altibacter sp. TaxID=2024823 RepID=UPI0025C641DB|nr:intradiol ring-cleavage dioxygenase [Altibacter sp.]
MKMLIDSIRIKQLVSATTILLVFAACNSQSDKQTNIKTGVGGPCEGCEAIFEYGDKVLSTIDTLPAFSENEPKLKITGTIFERDGKTPAKDVIVYIYHTNREGIYEQKGNETGWGTRHGFIRGWIKTDLDGKYTFYTFRPASYPNRDEPEHIHMTVKEPTRNEYYISDIVFDDDPLLTADKRNSLRDRCGSGLVKLKVENNILTAQRDIILGKNIPNYQ